MTPKAQLLNLIEQAPESHLGSLLHYAQQLQASTAAEALIQHVNQILTASQQFEDVGSPDALADGDRAVNQTEALQHTNGSNGLTSPQDSVSLDHESLQDFAHKAHASIFSDEKEIDLTTATFVTEIDPMQIIGMISSEGLSENIDGELYGQ